MNINPFELMKQMGTIESKMKSVKDEIEKLTATGSAGAGLVEVTMNGNFKILSINIADIVIDKNEKNTLEVLITSAVNDAGDKIRREVEAYTKRQAEAIGLKV